MERAELVEKLMEFKDQISFKQFWKEKPEQELYKMTVVYKMYTNEHFGADEALDGFWKVINNEFFLRKGLIDSGAFSLDG